ncbi:MAG: phosphate propanoyltransferase [Phycisphaeraceae bacterium]
MTDSLATLDRRQVEQMVRQVLRDRMGGDGVSAVNYRAPSDNAGPNPLVVNVSARHVHVTPQDLEVLFGPGAKLTKLKDLYQQGEFASEQTVNLIGPRNRMIPNVRILGPTRDYTQVELSYTDGVFLGIDLPLRISGNHKGTPGGILVGPHGALNINQGVIRAERHVHMSPADLAHFGVRDGDYMKLKIDGPCGVTFDRLKVREHPKVKLEVHIDTDEGNACHLPSATRMELIK